MKTMLKAVVASISALGLATQAQAHLVNTRLGDFYDGALHPLTGFEDALPWLALGILAAFQPVAHARWLILVLPLCLFLGGEASFLVPTLLPTPLQMAMTAIIGFSIAAAFAMPLWIFIGLSAVMGFIQGYQNARAMAETADALLFILGVTLSGYVVITLISAAATAFIKGSGQWRAIALRAGGSWVAAVCVMAFGLMVFSRS